MSRRASVLFALLLGLAPLAASAQTYGFITRLGRDTIALERVTRTGQRVVIDQVERAPRVIRRHAEYLLGADGTARTLKVEISTPNALSSEPRVINVDARFTRDTVFIVHKSSLTNRTVALPTEGYLTMPWATHMYGSYELLAAAAAKRKGNPITIRQFIPGRLLLDEGTMRKLGGVWELRTTALSGHGEITLDAQGRLTSYSGAKTTFLVDVERLASAPNIDATAAAFAATEKSVGLTGTLSVRGAAQAKIGKALIKLDYGRPLTRGRTLLGGIIPYGQVWRTGANAATQLTTSATIKLEGLELAPGTYTLWTMPSRTGVQLIVNKQSGQWGTEYDASQDLGHVPLTIGSNKVPLERFTITVEPTTKNAGNLAFEWGNFRWMVPVVVR